MYLSGGPGGAGVSEMLGVAAGIGDLEERYRMIGYDQRGTGRSGLLRCPRLERDPHLRDTGAAEDCANRLGVARHHYTTPDSVADMEAIRTELGAEKLTLFGISYGTELAIAYARAYPARVERLILDSVVDADDPDPFFTAGFRAMGPSLRSLCPDRCRGISADPAADMTQLVANAAGDAAAGVRLRLARALAPGHDRADAAARPDVPDRLSPAAAGGAAERGPRRPQR